MSKHLLYFHANMPSRMEGSLFHKPHENMRAPYGNPLAREYSARLFHVAQNHLKALAVLEIFKRDFAARTAENCRAGLVAHSDRGIKGSLPTLRHIIRSKVKPRLLFHFTNRGGNNVLSLLAQSRRALIYIAVYRHAILLYEHYLIACKSDNIHPCRLILMGDCNKRVFILNTACEKIVRLFPAFLFHPRPVHIEKFIVCLLFNLHAYHAFR